MVGGGGDLLAELGELAGGVVPAGNHRHVPRRAQERQRPRRQLVHLGWGKAGVGAWGEREQGGADVRWLSGAGQSPA